MAAPSDRKKDPLWSDYLQSVKRLDPARAHLPAKPPRKKTEPLRPSKESLPPVPVAPERPPEKIALPKKTERAMRRGKIDLDGSIDLHGMTQQEAFTVFFRFIKSKAQQGARRLLVVTGKGREGQSILRQNLPLWCVQQDLAPLILTVSAASPKHGDTGAFYITLRRPKKESAL